MSIVSFTEHIAEWNLSPIFRFLLKIYQGEELDNTISDIPVNAPWFGGALKLTEVEYLSFLFDEGRSNISHQIEFRELYFAAGRMSGKSLLSGITTAYTLADLVGQFRGDSSVTLTHAFPTLADAHSYKLYIHDVIEDVGMLRRQRIGDTLMFRHNGTGSVRALYTTGKSLRGFPTHTATFDEVAFMQNPEQMYQDVISSISKFQGKFFAIGTPQGKSGFFYEKIRAAMEGKIDDTMVLQIPTWEMNLYRSKENCRKLAGNEQRFREEFGAEFINRETLQ